MPAPAQSNDEQLDEEQLFEQRFIEQAEYLAPDQLKELNAEHPEELSILRKLKAGGAKLLVGPRGCGKTTLMLKAYHETLSEITGTAFPVYVNFKLSLKLEPLYVKTPNAPFWFRTWLTLKILEAMWNAIAQGDHLSMPPGVPEVKAIRSWITSVERGDLNTYDDLAAFSTQGLTHTIEEVLSHNNKTRCILLMDDAAHAFSAKQQEDFFDFFREIKSRQIAPKAAIYPGITSHSATFHVGHDAEQVDVWVRPLGGRYEAYMRQMAAKRFGGELPARLLASPNAVEFLAYASFGIPRVYLNMIRAIFEDEGKYLSSEGSIDRRRLLELARTAKESAHSVYESLEYKLPSYSNFVGSGGQIYQSLLQNLKGFNKGKPANRHGIEVGIKKPLPPELERVIGFLQYAGLLMPSGENSRGEKGTFEIYMVHFGDLITENVIVSLKTKRVENFVKVFRSQSHQAWPRIAPPSLTSSRSLGADAFKLTLPHCQNCGAERLSEHAKFCHNCGTQLKSTSLYDELVDQDISALPISSTLVKRIKSNSKIRKVRDILIDSDRTQLRGVKWVGPIRAQRISNWAEEYVA